MDQTRAGARAVIFEDWKALQKNDTALGEAAAFAETLARNPALYVPLRRVDPPAIARSRSTAARTTWKRTGWNRLTRSS